MHGNPGLILGLRPANKRRRYKVTPPIIGWEQTWNQPCNLYVLDVFEDASFTSSSENGINISSMFLGLSLHTTVCEVNILQRSHTICKQEHSIALAA